MLRHQSQFSVGFPCSELTNLALPSLPSFQRAVQIQVRNFALKEPYLHSASCELHEVSQAGLKYR
jgi:hypothetical protein